MRTLNDTFVFPVIKQGSGIAGLRTAIPEQEAME